MALDATPLERFWVIAFSSWNCLSSNLSSIACNDGVIAKLAVMHSACRSCWSAQILSLLLLLGRLKAASRISGVNLIHTKRRPQWRHERRPWLSPAGAVKAVLKAAAPIFVTANAGSLISSQECGNCNRINTEDRGNIGQSSTVRQRNSTFLCCLGPCVFRARYHNMTLMVASSAIPPQTTVKTMTVGLVPVSCPACKVCCRGHIKEHTQSWRCAPATYG